MRAHPLIFVVALALSASACGGPADTPATSAEPQKPATPTATWRGDGPTIEFTVANMDCSGCASTIRKVLEAMDGVDAVTADSKTGLVTVTLAEGAARDPLISAIPGALKSHGGKEFEILQAAP